MAHDIAPALEYLAVPIGKVRSHPQNPRLGQVDVIVESLASHGQYRPIVVQRSTGHILAGNHTWMAAKQLGWDAIAVVYVDVDDDQAARIVLVDNRSSDLGTYDTAGLLDLLEQLDDFTGTGWDESDVDRLQAALEASLNLDSSKAERSGKMPDKDAIRVTVGRIGMVLPTPAWDVWHQRLIAQFGEDNRTAYIAHFRFVLDLPRDIERAARKPSRVRKVSKAAPATEHPHMDEMKVRVDSLKQATGNPRQGDIGMIAESLRLHGQYRPIVVNRRTMQVLAGNHTWQAAKALGWKEIAATFVDVDDEEALRILLVDNRAADMAGYDQAVLARMLQGVSTWEGTGFESDDVAALLAGYGMQRDDLHTPVGARPPDRPNNAASNIGPYSFSTPQVDYDTWEYKRRLEVGHEPQALAGWVADRLGLPEGWQVWRMLRPKERLA